MCNESASSNLREVQGSHCKDYEHYCPLVGTSFLTDEVSFDPDSVSRVSFLEAKPVEKTYLSHQKYV
jgi:hypothetical protein